jgi:membrane protease YdiL (CAAX protease family)
MKGEHIVNQSDSSPAARRFSLGLYLLIVFGISWPFQIAGAILAKNPALSFVLNSASMVMVAAGTFIAGRFIFRDGFANAGWRWGKPKNYLAVLGLVALLWVFPTLIRGAVGTLQSDDVDTTKIIWLFALPLVTLIPGFGEEFGWRGYMLPHLACRLGARRAVTVHALVWWAWHLPILVGGAVRAGVAGAAETGLPIALSVAVAVPVVLAAGAIPTIMHGIVFAYIWARSDSLAAATVYHAAYDGVRDSLGLVVGLPTMVGVWSNAILTILGIAFLWKGNWSKLKRITETAPETAPPAPAAGHGADAD